MSNFFNKYTHQWHKHFYTWHNKLFQVCTSRNHSTLFNGEKIKLDGEAEQFTAPVISLVYWIGLQLYLQKCDQKLSVQIQDGGWMPYWKTASMAKNWHRNILYEDSKPDISNAQRAEISNFKNSIWHTNSLIWMKLCKISQTGTISKISQMGMPDVANTFRAQLCYRHMICATSKKQKIIHQHIEIICHNAATILFDSQLAPFSRRDCTMHNIVRSKTENIILVCQMHSFNDR